MIYRPRVLGLLAAVCCAAWILGPDAYAAKKTEKEFKAKFFGEGGQTYPNTPDQSDYQTSEPEHAKPAASAPSTLPAVQAPVPAPVAKPVAVVPADPRETGAVVVARPAGMPAVDPSMRHVWPGATRPGQAPAQPSQAPAASAEPMKDAPASARYSLWAGLNAPMMLPASKVGELSADQAKTIGRMDYESHILGAKSEAGMPMEKGPGGPSLADAAPLAESGDGLFVTIDLDVSATPGEYRDALNEISQRSGLRLDERFPPSFGDAARTRISVKGWVAPSQLGEVFGPNVQRLRVERAAARGVPDLPVTELLVGIRIPQGASPNATLASALERLGQPGFKLKRVIGYQPIPGTSQMVLVVAGKVPVQHIAQVLGDPLVVKVVPSPEAAPSAPETARGIGARLSKRFFAYAASKEPRLLVGTVLMTLLLAGTFFLRARKR